MKNKILLNITMILLLLSPKANFGQAPNLGTTANFALFTTVGAVSNAGIPYLTKVTGNVGTNSAPTITGFGNVDGQMHYGGDPQSTQASVDLLVAYGNINAAIPTFFPAPLLGNGQILNAGVYAITAPTITLNNNLTLDAQNNPGAIFIIQLNGAFNTNANSQVILANGAQACNVFWKVEGLVDMATGTSMKGTLIVNNAAINMNTGVTLEGRALTTAGAITVDGLLAYTPRGCGLPLLTGPNAPNLASMECYTIFSSDGPVTNTGITNVVGDVGTNNGTATGYNPLLVTGMIHAVPDFSTATGAIDLLNAYTYLDALPFDIELLFPAQFGNNLVLTPHTYIMNGAVTFTDTVILNAEGNPNAVFVIQVKGAFATSTFSNVKMINGTKAENVYWMVDGAVSINNFSVFNGTIVCNNAAMNLTTGVQLYGRALTTTGALSTFAINATMPPGCGGTSAPLIITQPTDQSACNGGSVNFTVSATGTNLTYQWRKGTTNLTNVGNISGVTTPTLTINPVSIADTASNYNVVVSGTFAPSQTSNFVSLTIDSAASINTQPTNQTACVGDSTGFTATTTGTVISYQWRKGTVNLINAGNISGVTTANLTINPVNIGDTASDYNLIITGGCLPNDTSNFVSLTIDKAIITSEPTNQTACVGDSTGFTVSTTGTVVSYQWRKGTINLINAGNISGATTATLTINPVNIADTASNYNLIVTGVCLPNDTSNFVSLTIGGAVITAEPTNQTACIGDSTGFTVTTTGTIVSYQWRKGTSNLINGGNISGATSATLIINPVSVADTASDYNLIITGTCLPNDTSNFVSLTLKSNPIANATSNSPVCIGDSINLTATTVFGAIYNWTGPNSYASTNQNPVILSATTLEAGIYSLTVTNFSCTSNPSNITVVVNDCSTSDTLVVLDFNIPEGFSPNNDGTNDLFVIRGIDRFPANTFVIFNRWGNKLFEASPYKNEWDGKSTLGIRIGGDELPVGTYFYLLDLGDGSTIYKGTIYLNK